MAPVIPLNSPVIEISTANSVLASETSVIHRRIRICEISLLKSLYHSSHLAKFEGKLPHIFVTFIREGLTDRFFTLRAVPITKFLIPATLGDPSNRYRYNETHFSSVSTGSWEIRLAADAREIRKANLFGWNRIRPFAFRLIYFSHLFRKRQNDAGYFCRVFGIPEMAARRSRAVKGCFKPFQLEYPPYSFC